MHVSPLTIPSFRRLFAAQVIALVGTGLSTIALTLLAFDLVGGNAASVLGTALAYVALNCVLMLVGSGFWRRGTHARGGNGGWVGRAGSRDLLYMKL